MSEQLKRGALYVVPTPIGNLADITERAKAVLAGVDFIAAEDTRVSGKLTALYGIKAHFVSYHEHNRQTAGKAIAERLLSGETGALVTDAGTPAVSDPGENLVRLCREKGITVVPLPGPCAFVTALAGSGFPSRRFAFEGFLPPDKAERQTIVEGYKHDKKTVIFHEAPHRLEKTVGELLDALGDRRVCVARELTKVNEEFEVTTLAAFLESLAGKPPRGEYVLIVEGAPEEVPGEAFFEGMSMEEHVAFYEKQGLCRMDAIKACARDRGLPKNAVYKALL